MKILVINGPNLNMLGKREPDIYGHESLTSIENDLEIRFPDHQFIFFQSNNEGEIIEKLHEAAEGDFDALLGNFAGFTHTSIAIRDAISLFTGPRVEVHISNIYARENFRHHSITGGVCNGVITGFGPFSYVLGVQALENIVTKR
ncbi:MAG: type II 3-dehydroquinate dehydratase [Balneolales bacterium]